MDLISGIRENAKRAPKRIVLPEGYEERNLKAAEIITKEKLAHITLLGDPDRIRKEANHQNVSLQNIEIIDPLKNPKKADYIDLMLKIRKSKGLTEQEAAKLIENPLYLGCLMIKAGDADGEVAGAINSTGDVLRPALQYIKTRQGISVVSGAFIMILKDAKWGSDGILVFADCAVNPQPTAEELAQIAISTSYTAKKIAGIDPKIAMLSFSTKGSANHETVDKVLKATRIAKEMEPGIQIDGELQADAAIVEKVASLKAPDSTIAGKANVLVFPSLEAGNIGYKLVQRLAGAEAVGPILQGMASPVNDLSRGCSVDDIVNVVSITVLNCM